MTRCFALAAGGLLAIAALAHEPGELGAPPLPLLSPAAGSIEQDVERPRQRPGQTLPVKPARTLSFTTTSGTWMSLDLSPDGKTILFDLLGDLYAMPVSGGKARQLSRGLGFDTQPAFSRDGSMIAFISDHSGADNLWIARADGSGARQISFGEDDTVLVSPAWSADGRSVFLSRYRPSLNNYELWRYDLDGRTTLIAPIRKAPDDAHDSWQSSLGAVASPDGGFLYFARNRSGLAFDEPEGWTIVRRDLASGEETEIVRETDERRSSGRGSYFRPALSPDGRLLAYATRLRGQTELRVRDLASGLDRRVASPIEPDQLQASMWQDIIPRYAFSPDGEAIILSRNGGFERIALDGTATAIPFSTDVKLAVAAPTRVDIREDKGPVRARLIQSPVASPDGRTLIFSALAQLYRATLDGKSAPVALPTGDAPAFQPSWSPDGRAITFVTWSEKDGGAVWTMAAEGSSPPVRLSEIPAYYSYPVFTPDGQAILAVRSAQAERLADSFEYGLIRNAELVSIPLAGGPPRMIMRGRIGGRPQFVKDEPGAAFVLTDEGLSRIDLASGARSLAALVKGPGWYFQNGSVPVDDVRISPDGKWLLALVAQQLHLAASPPSGGTVDLLDPKGPHRRLTDSGADFFEWADDGRTITWSLGSTFHRRALNSIVPSAVARPDWTPALQRGVTSYPMAIEVPRDVPQGRLLLRGARVISMANDAVIENADLVIDGDRFVAVGPRGSLTVPSDAVIRDVTGKTIIPGLIDTHDHIGGVRREVLGLDDWGLQARLAYGVTTSFDPSTLTIDMLAYQDLLDAGMMVGPRLRSTGTALFSMNRLQSLDDARAVLRRYRDDYRLRNIKEYRIGDRRARQWTARAARELGLQPTTEGALSLKLDLTQMLDGYAGNEHALPAVLHDDVLTLMRLIRVGYTTTLSINHGGFPAEDWFVIRHASDDEAKLRTVWPGHFIDAKFRARHWHRIEEYRFPVLAASAAEVQRKGGLVGMGAHGELPGIGFHYEMEAHDAGGMKPIEILHAATIGAAEVIGRSADLGSIAPGKLADLVILDRDPREKIVNARAVSAIMRGGRLYDGSLNEIWPDRHILRPYWKATEDSAAIWLADPTSKSEPAR